MLSTSFVFKRISYQETTEAITKVAWNKTDGWVAFGGDQGLLRIIMLEFADEHDFALYGVAARPSRVSLDRKLTIHEGSAVTTITWNEQKEQITTGDSRGAVVVCGYNQTKWISELVNESVQSPVVTAVWASDSSKVLLFYQSGQLLLGASTGHKILSMQVRYQEQAKFAFVTDSHYDVFWTGWETKIIAYNFDSSERYRTALQVGDKYIAACLLEFRDQLDTPKIIAVTMHGHLIIYNAIEGTTALQQQIPLVATDVYVSPNSYFIAVAGYAVEGDYQQENSAIVRIYRTRDLENIANIRITAKNATSISWDASSLRLAIGTENALYFACLRLSYRHFMLQDGTVVYSSGSSLIKSSQIVSKLSAIKKDEIITFWKPATNSFVQRQPAQFIDQCACGQYMAILTGRNVERADGTVKMLASLTIHSSVGAPVLTLDLAYVPFYLAGCDNYVVTCSPSRISVYDLRFLTGEVRSDSAEIETKLDAGLKYSGIIEWHADSSPFAADRELHIAKLSVSTPITAISVGNSAFFVARANSTVQRYNLPSLQSNVRVYTGAGLKVLTSNCNGTAIAGVTEAGQLIVYYTEDFIQPESQLKVERLKDPIFGNKGNAKKEEEKPKFDVLKQEAPVDELQKMLGFDGQAPRVEKQTKKVATAAETKQLKQVMYPWETRITEVWGIYWNSEDPNLLAISTKHKIIILHVNKKAFEDPIVSSAHILAFKGLIINSAYLDESVMYGQPTGQSYKEFEGQQLRELKEVMFGKIDQLDEPETKPTNLIKVFGNVYNDFSKVRQTANVQAGYYFLLGQYSPHSFLFKIVAECALRELALDIASYCFIRAEDYISYHFTEYIRRIGSDELRRAEVCTFLGDFSTAEHILVKQLGRVDLAIKNEVDLGMWMKILYTWTDSRNNASQVAIVSDELATTAQRQIGLYYLRYRRYVEAANFLSKADDINLYAEALFRAEDYDTLHTLSYNLSVNENHDAIVYVSRILTRIGDVDGATAALLRLNKAEDAIKVCIYLKRFDRAIYLATEFYMLEVVDKHLSEYLRQLLSSGDDKAALDLLRKTNYGEIAACIIIGAAMENLKQSIDSRQFPIKPGMFNRVRRLIALAGKEATLVQRYNMERNLKRGVGNGLLTGAQVDKTIDYLLNDNPTSEKQDSVEQSARETLLEDPMFARFGNKAKSTAMIWKLVKQTRYIVVASYMLYIGRPQSALFPAIEASGFYYKILSTAGNVQNVVDEEYRYFQKLALPIAIFAALYVEDFDLASYLMEVLESDDSIPSLERDQLEQLAVDVFSRFPPVEPKNVQKDACVQCEKCRGMMPRYSTICSCGYQCQLCSRTGVPIKQGHKVQKCQMCGSLCTVGKQPCTICPMCHEPFANE